MIRASKKVPLNMTMLKAFRLLGGFTPEPLNRDPAPGPRWGSASRPLVIG